MWREDKKGERDSEVLKNRRKKEEQRGSNSADKCSIECGEEGVMTCLSRDGYSMSSMDDSSEAKLEITFFECQVGRTRAMSSGPADMGFSGP